MYAIILFEGASCSVKRNPVYELISQKPLLTSGISTIDLNHPIYGAKRYLVKNGSRMNLDECRRSFYRDCLVQLHSLNCFCPLICSLNVNASCLGMSSVISHHYSSVLDQSPSSQARFFLLHYSFSFVSLISSHIPPHPEPQL